jgi:hypothetical protein
MIIKVITAYDKNYDNMFDANHAILSNYCDKHGYQLFIKKIENFDRPASWYKIQAILQEMNDDCDYIFWMDADTLILNMQQKIEDLLDDTNYLFISQDKFSINAGIFCVKNNLYMIDFLHKVYDLYSIYNEYHPLGGVYEQSAILHLLQYNYNNIRSYLKVFDGPITNAYDPETKPAYVQNYVSNKSFILHTPNTKPDSIRSKVIEKYISMYHQNNKD